MKTLWCNNAHSNGGGGGGGRGRGEGRRGGPLCMTLIYGCSPYSTFCPQAPCERLPPKNAAISVEPFSVSEENYMCSCEKQKGKFDLQLIYKLLCL